jgi:hypothetical protein
VHALIHDAVGSVPAQNVPYISLLWIGHAAAVATAYTCLFFFSEFPLFFRKGHAEAVAVENLYRMFQ